MARTRGRGWSGRATLGGRRGRRWRRGLVTAALLAVAVVAGPVAVARLSTAGDIHDGVTGVRQAPVAIVLGAGVDGAGRPSPFLSQRVEVGADLYRTGRVKALLMSGDNSRTDYDEVKAMATAARRLGVPGSAIVTDHAGFDTYSSCYRARHVWGLTRAVVVSQPFHLPRAVWLCERLGIETQGAATVSSYLGPTVSGWVREIPAIDKAAVDLLTGRKPTFPGPPERTLTPLLSWVLEIEV
jgi:vancomycin permeability regulator SanA